MTYVLAVDVGTSFTAAAVVRFNQGVPPVPECLPLGLRGTAVPSVVYYPEQGPVLVGEAAERRGLATPERIVREFKRRIGDAVPISLGTLSVRPEEVFATVARWVADRAAEREGAAPSDIILTHPAAWGSHRTSAVREALAAKGLHDVTLLAEPEAAALHYASQVRVEEGSTIAVYDLGGGTFDTAVLTKAGDDRFEAVGRPEGIDHLGGADFDAAVFRYVAEHTGRALADLDPSDPDVLAALSRLRRECVEAKEALSSDSETTIPVLLPGFQQQVRLVRSEFEALIEEPVRETVDALEESLAQLKLAPADLSAVLLIGGSSRIPLVAELISEQLDRPIAVDADPKSSICLGAAVSVVLSRAAAGRAALAEAPQLPAPASGEEPLDTGGHVPARLASWSRKRTTAAGAFAAPSHGPGHSHGGVHAPKPRVRLTAIAAAAAVFTVLSATAAHSPENFSDLASVFVPKADADDGSASQPDGAGAGSPAGVQAGDGNQQQVIGIEAGAENSDVPGTAFGAGDLPINTTTAAATSEGPGGGSAAGAGPSAAAVAPTSASVPGTPSGSSAPGSTPTTGAGTVEPGPGTPTTVPTSPGTDLPELEPPTNQPSPEPSPSTGTPDTPATPVPDPSPEPPATSSAPETPPPSGPEPGPTPLTTEPAA